MLPMLLMLPRSLLDACTFNSSDANKRSRFFMCHMLNGKPYFATGGISHKCDEFHEYYLKMHNVIFK